MSGPIPGNKNFDLEKALSGHPIKTVGGNAVRNFQRRIMRDGTLANDGMIYKFQAEVFYRDSSYETKESWHKETFTEKGFLFAIDPNNRLNLTTKPIIGRLKKK